MGNYAVMNFLFANTSLTARTNSTTLLGPKATAEFVMGNLSTETLLYFIAVKTFLNFISVKMLFD